MDDLTPMLFVLAAAAPLVLLLAIGFPSAFMILAFALTPFQQALLGENSTIALGVVDVVATILLLPLWINFLKNRRLSTGAVGWSVVYFLLIAAISTSANGVTETGIVSLVRMGMSTIIALLIYSNLSASVFTFHKCYMAFLIACNVLSICVIFAFVSGGTQASMSTLGLNKNYIGPVLGSALCVAAVCLMIESPRGWKKAWIISTLVLATGGLVFSLSRGGWISTVSGMLVAMSLTRNVRAILASTLMAMVVIGAAWHFLPADSVAYASDISTGAHTIQTRFDTMEVVLKAFSDSPVIGVGVGLRKEAEPHDVLISTLGESGVLGIIGFVVMFATAFGTIYSASRRCEDDAVTRSVIGMAAVVLCVSIVDGLMDVYWRRGMGFMGWAGVGIAIQLMQTHSVVPTATRKLTPLTTLRRQGVRA